MDQFVNNLKRQAQENPLMAIVIGATALSAVRGVLMSGVHARNSRAWSQEVARRAMKDSLK